MPIPSLTLPHPATRVLRPSLRHLTLHTEILIDAGPQRVWQVLTDFAGYPAWNASIPQAEGEARAGTRLRVVIQWPGLQAGPYQLQILNATAGRELRWLGHFGRTGLMDGDHRFTLEPSGEGQTKVIQSEHFSGWLVPFFAPWLRKNVRLGFELMNAALKKRVEGLRKPGPGWARTEGPAP